MSGSALRQVTPLMLDQPEAAQRWMQPDRVVAVDHGVSAIGVASAWCGCAWRANLRFTASAAPLVRKNIRALWRPMGRSGLTSVDGCRNGARLMASPRWLKRVRTFSDEGLAERGAVNVVWHHASGMAFRALRLPCGATQIGRFCSPVGEAGVGESLKATIDVQRHRTMPGPRSLCRLASA